MTNLHPRFKKEIVSHDKNYSFFSFLLQKGLIDNSWIFFGKKGIGKATFAYNLARDIFNRFNVYGDDAFKEKLDLQINIGSYPYIFSIDSEFGEISVENVRLMQNFLSKTAPSGFYRVVIIDSLDELNRFSLNCLLKSIEGSSKNVVFFLISHNLSIVPLTILSRSQKIFFNQLSHENLKYLCDLYGLSASEDAINYSLGSFGNLIDISSFGSENISEIKSIIFSIKNDSMYSFKLKNFAKKISKNESLVKTFLFVFQVITYDYFVKNKNPNYDKMSDFINKAKDCYLCGEHLVISCITLFKTLI